MKLLRFGPARLREAGVAGHERGDSRSVGRGRACRPARIWRDKELAKLRKIKPDSLPLVDGKPQARRALPRHQQVHRDRTQLRRSCGRVRCAGALGADPVLEGDHLHQRPQRRHRDSAQFDQDRLGGRTRRRHRRDRAVRGARARARHVAGYCMSTTYRSATSSSSAAANGTTARAATPSARSGRIW